MNDLEIITPDELPPKILRFYEDGSIAIKCCTRKEVSKSVSSNGVQYAAKALDGDSRIWNLTANGWKME